MWVSQKRFDKLHAYVYDLERRLSEIESVLIPRYFPDGASADAVPMRISDAVSRLIKATKLRQIYQHDEYRIGPIK